jgi:hypothetical protein
MLGVGGSPSSIDNVLSLGDSKPLKMPDCGESRAQCSGSRTSASAKCAPGARRMDVLRGGYGCLGHLYKVR